MIFDGFLSSSHRNGVSYGYSSVGSGWGTDEMGVPSSHSDFPWNKQSINGGYPPFMEPPQMCRASLGNRNFACLHQPLSQRIHAMIWHSQFEGTLWLHPILGIWGLWISQKRGNVGVISGWFLDNFLDTGIHVPKKALGASRSYQLSFPATWQYNQLFLKRCISSVGLV